jgi:Rrf2 family protein
MRRDSKLSSVLHVLLHMAQQDRPFTSEELAQFLDTNPALVRRTLAGLRERGYIASTKGHGGGWRLACDLGAVTLRDIYNALDQPSVFAMGNRSEQPACLVEQVVNDSLATAFDEAEALLIARFAGVTLRELSEDFNRRYAAHPHGKDHHGHP